MSTHLEVDSGLSLDKSVNMPLVSFGIPKPVRNMQDSSFQRTREPLQHALSLQMVNMLLLQTRAMITWSLFGKCQMDPSVLQTKVVQTLFATWLSPNKKVNMMSGLLEPSISPIGLLMKVVERESVSSEIARELRWHVSLLMT